MMMVGLVPAGTGGPADSHAHRHEDEGGHAHADPRERLHEVEVGYRFDRDGSVSFEQTFRLGVAGAAIQRGPVLNYLTVSRGIGGLVFDHQLEILSVERDGSAEPFRLERGSGFASLFVGSDDQLLDPGDHAYVILGRMEADWQRRDGELSTSLDVLGPFPTLPVDAARVSVRLPDGVAILRHSVGIASGQGAGLPYRTDEQPSHLVVESTGALDGDRFFFVNLAWPESGFQMKSQWLKVLIQHPRIPLAVFSGTLLVWTLAVLLTRIGKRHAAAR